MVWGVVGGVAGAGLGWVGDVGGVRRGGSDVLGGVASVPSSRRGTASLAVATGATSASAHQSHFQALPSFRAIFTRPSSGLPPNAMCPLSLLFVPRCIFLSACLFSFRFAECKAGRVARLRCSQYGSLGFSETGGARRCWVRRRRLRLPNTRRDLQIYLHFRSSL